MRASNLIRTYVSAIIESDRLGFGSEMDSAMGPLPDSYFDAISERMDSLNETMFSCENALLELAGEADNFLPTAPRGRFNNITIDQGLAYTFNLISRDTASAEVRHNLLLIHAGVATEDELADNLVDLASELHPDFVARIRADYL